MADQIKEQMSDTSNSRKILTGKPERKRLLGRNRCKWDITIHLKQQNVWKSIDWIHLAQDRNQWWYIVNTVMNLLVSNTARYLMCSK
jgi:hypothetical protein